MFMQLRTLATIGWISARPELNGAEYARKLIERACDFARQQ